METPGTTIGPYRVLRTIASGGMGTVYRAEGPPGPVALKVIHPHLLSTPGFRERFLREGEIGRRIRHENVVATLDCGAAESDGAPRLYLAMEFVDGATLRSLLTELERVPESLCRHIAREVARGLAAIHEAGVIHRDLKPENVLITRDHVVKVMDLGVARAAEEAMRLSLSGNFVGSVLYASPEQFAGPGAELDGRADLYSLGVVLYELCSGAHPYPSEGFAQAVAQAVEKEPRRLGESVPQLSPFFEEVVHALLAKDRERRFPSARALADTLDAGERSDWWRERSRELRAQAKRPLRRIRIPREAALYGRDADLAVLAGLFERTKAGDGQVLLLEGEAGIGKTRLLDDFVGRLEVGGEDLDFLLGSYPPGGAATALGAFRAAFRDHFGDRGSAPWLGGAPLLAPAFDALLRGDPPPEGREPLTKDSLHTCFVHATRSLAAERPTILLVEDLHFAPEEGRALFAALAQAAAGHRILLVGTTRPGLPGGWVANLTRLPHATRRELARLGPKHLALLLRDAFRSEALADDLGHRIALKSDGNPFFALEIIRGLKEDRALARSADGRWITTRVIRDLVVPSSVLDLVQARIAELTEEDRAALDVAACLGFEFDPLLLAAALDLPRIPTLQRLSRIERVHRLVRSAGERLVFDHHQVQEALYAAIPELLKREYHGAIGQAIEARAPRPDGATSVALADHFLLAARGERALVHLPAALAHLERSYLNEPAIQLAGRALAAPGLLAGRARAEMLLRMADRLETLGRRDAQRTALDEAASLADAEGDPGLRARARRALGWFLFVVGRPDEAEPQCTEAVTLARAAGDRAVEAAATANLGIFCAARSRHEEARAFLTSALTLARETGDRRMEAGLTGNLGMLAAMLGRTDEAIESYRQALHLAREIGDRRAECIATVNLGSALSKLGRHDEVLAHYEQALSLARDIGNRATEAMALGNLGVLAWNLGRTAEALPRIEKAVSLSREIGDRRGEARASGNLGRVLLDLGRRPEAAHAIEAALAAARANGDRLYEGYALLGLGLERREAGDLDGAGARFEESARVRSEIGDRGGLAKTLVEVASLRAEQGNLDAAKRALSEAEALARDTGVLEARVLALAERAALPGEDASAAEALLAENATALTLGSALRARWLLYRATGRPGHLAEARRLLDFLVGNAPADDRRSVVECVRVHREVAAGR